MARLPPLLPSDGWGEVDERGLESPLVALAFHALAQHLAIAAHGLGAFPLAARRPATAGIACN